MDVLGFSQKTKREADELLKHGKVLEVLSKYGKPVLGGSYAYDLMYGPDIDITVLSDKPEEVSFNALKDFIEQRNFQKYQLGDFIKFPREHRPQGIIVVLIQEYQGRKWEIEIWFNREIVRDDVDEELENLLMKVSDKQKETILSLKHQRESFGVSKHKIDSPTIYRGVLMEGKVNIEDY